MPCTALATLLKSSGLGSWTDLATNSAPHLKRRLVGKGDLAQSRKTR